jgi:uncharacterized protein (DUF302 family)
VARSISQVAMAVLLTATQTFAGEGKRYTTKAPFDDVRFELGNAVTTRGFAAHSEGNLGKMLERTGVDVGATKTVYKQAEFVTFCSAVFTRKLVEADPAEISNCPFQVFAYETVDKPGEVVVGYRGLGTPRSAASGAVYSEVEAMLDAIIKDAIK